MRRKKKLFAASMAVAVASLVVSVPAWAYNSQTVNVGDCHGNQSNSWEDDDAGTYAAQASCGQLGVKIRYTVGGGYYTTSATWGPWWGGTAFTYINNPPQLVGSYHWLAERGSYWYYLPM